MAKYRYVCTYYEMKLVKNTYGYPYFTTDEASHETYKRVSTHDTLDEAIKACDEATKEVHGIYYRSFNPYKCTADYYCVEREELNDDSECWDLLCEDPVYEAEPSKIAMDMAIYAYLNTIEDFEYSYEDLESQFLPIFNVTIDSVGGDKEVAKLFSAWLDWHGVENFFSDYKGVVNSDVPRYIIDYVNELWEQFCEFGK